MPHNVRLSFGNVFCKCTVVAFCKKHNLKLSRKEVEDLVDDIKDDVEDLA